jgi:hypothetical protein
MSGNIVFAATQTFPPPVGYLPLTGGVITGSLGIEGTTFINSNSAGEFGLPATAGAAGEQLTSNGDGTTSWAAAATGSLPLSGGTMSGNIVFAGTQTFPNTLSTAGGTMTGDITFAATQSFPIATTSALGVVKPDGTTITVDGTGLISAVAAGTLQTITDAGATTTNSITTAGLVAQGSVTVEVLTTSLSNRFDVIYDPAGANSMVARLNLNGLTLGYGTANAELRFLGTTSGDWVGFKSPGSFTGQTVWSLPPADGTAGQVLSTNGGGVLGWSSVAGSTLQTVTDNGASTTNTILVTNPGATTDVSVAPSGLSYSYGGQQTLNIGNGINPSFTMGQGGALQLGTGNLGAFTPTIVLQGSSGKVGINSAVGVATLTVGGTINSDTVTTLGAFQISRGGSAVGLLSDTGSYISNDFTVDELIAAGLNYPTVDGTAGQVITTDGAGNLSFTANLGANALPLTGGTMTGTITFAAGQTISGYVANTLYSTTGDIAYASSGNTPARLGIGAAGTILASNAGLPAWRTATQLGLLTSSAASTTYAPLNSPTFTGPVTVNAGGPAGSNALVVSGGNLVLSTSFTPTSSADTGSTGELAWDSNYLYFCYAPNSWGRVAVDLTPF